MESSLVLSRSFSSFTTFSREPAGKIFSSVDKNWFFNNNKKGPFISPATQKLSVVCNGGGSGSRRRSSVIVAAKKGPKKKFTDEIYFPESVLLKEKKLQEDGSFRPDFADEKEKNLYEALTIKLESDYVERVRHYEVVYLINEDNVDEVESVNQRIQDFLAEKRGRIWRVNDWGLRKLAYKIQKVSNAHYMLMNFEMEAKWINDFKSLLDTDLRIIRYLVIKRDEAITEDCPPPPDFDTVHNGVVYVDDDGEDDDDDEDFEDEEFDDEDYDDEEYDDEEEEGEDEGEDTADVDEDTGDDKKDKINGKARRKPEGEKVGR